MCKTFYVIFISCENAHLVTTQQSVTIFWCSMCWVGKPSRPHIWTSQSEIAYVSGNRCCSHIPRKRGLALGKLLAIDTRDTPDTLTSLWGQIQPRHTHSHTLTQKHSNMIPWWCSHTPARALGWTESTEIERSRCMTHEEANVCLCLFIYVHWFSVRC